MKKIEAIIRESKFEGVKKALHEEGVNFFSYWDVTGAGHETVESVYRGVSFSTTDIKRRLLSIVVNDEFVEPAIKAIQSIAHTGNVGDGKIFVYPIEDALSIRTGKRGNESVN